MDFDDPEEELKNNNIGQVPNHHHHQHRHHSNNQHQHDVKSDEEDDEDDLGFDDDVLIFDSDIHNRDNNYYESLEAYLNRDQRRYDNNNHPNNNNNGRGQQEMGLLGHSRFTFTAKEGMPDPASFNIYSACKAGDLGRVKHLVEVEDVDINRADLFDSVPLFYACLCGHPHVVKYLLDKGAKLDASTFVGARCYYGALDDSIRTLLRSYQAKPSELDELAEAYARVILKNPSTPFADFEFVVQDRPIRVHRLFIMSHCEYFQKLLSSAPWIWKSRLRFKDTKRVRYQSFLAFIRYLYTDQLQIEVDTADMASLVYLLNRLKMKKLCHTVTNCIDQAKKRGMRQVIIRPRQKSIRLREVSKRVHQDLLHSKRSRSYPDMKLKFNLSDGTVLEVKSHRVILWARSEYFRVLLSGQFKDSELLNADRDFLESLEEDSKENQSWNLYKRKTLHELEVLTLHNTTKRIVSYFMEFVYTGDIAASNELTDLTEEMSDAAKIEESSFWYDLLLVSEIYIMQDLKFLCLRQLCKLVSLPTLWRILSVGMHHGSKRVIDACMDYIRSCVRTVYTSQEFDELIQSEDPTAKDLRRLMEDEMEGLWEYMVNAHQQESQNQ
eukprot:TRINITY_DN8201_c0_g1_i3.p1 TRINITY_DN8201_c0_g1~~TRINITY_DN8201_c0_g1_i3.p1  ORF type:complete len:609 (-),score=144.26 TRINITY_DN8201_c0_g1_i3:31-1857(-)